MKIRSITYFCNPGWPLNEQVLQTAGRFFEQARRSFESAGFEVQSTRLATVPFPRLLGVKKLDSLKDLSEQLEKSIERVGIAYASIGPALLDTPYSYEVIPEAMAATHNIFFSASMADKNTGLSLAAVKACAEIIRKAAAITPDGFANLRFAALANVEAGSPFFPAAYAGDDHPAFALATEAADLAVEAFSRARSLEAGRSSLIENIEKNALKLAQTAAGLSEARFGGIDFSLAPFPQEARSLATAFERLGVPAIGLHGSLAAAALLTECIDRADFPHTGFCGLMMPVLEDATLAARAAQGTLSVKDVLLYSAVCGTGLDTIPLPGDIRSELLHALLLDLCALALRLDKPLTARLMPIPNKKAGDPIHFDFEYFADSRVMSLEAQPLTGLFNSPEAFKLISRH